jgi:hypothetical protein
MLPKKNRYDSPNKLDNLVLKEHKLQDWEKSCGGQDKIVYVNGAVEMEVSNPAQAFEILQKAILQKDELLCNIAFDPLKRVTFSFSIIIECKDI